MLKVDKVKGKKAASIFVTILLIGLILFVLVPPATSVNLTTGYPFENNEIIFGNTITFNDVNLTIRGEEKIPVTLLNFSIYNKTGAFIDSVEFNAQGIEQLDSNNAFTVSLDSMIQSDWYDHDYGYGYDEPEGPGYDFGYGYGYGYGDGTSDITFLYDIEYTVRQSGTFHAQFFVNSTPDNSSYNSHTFDSEVSADFVIEDYTFYEGWNLITMPAQNTITAEQLASNITSCEMISWFDATNQTYKTYVNGSAAYDFNLEDGYGLFVYVSQNTSVNISGAEITSVSVPLEVGWDTIGWYKETDTNLTNLANSITGTEFISWYNTTGETFETYTGPGSTELDVTRGLGLFVYVNETSTWQGEG